MQSERCTHPLSSAIQIFWEERGKSTVWAMLLCIAATTGYIKYGRLFMSEHLPTFYHGMIIAILSVVTLFTLGCVINMLLVGERSQRQQRRELTQEIAELRTFINDSLSKINDLSNRASLLSQLMRPRSVESLSTARRIVRALTLRLDEVEQLLATRRTVDLIDAFELFNSDLDVVENCMESLIGANPIPPLPPEHWMPTVRQHLDAVSFEIERIAA